MKTEVIAILLLLALIIALLGAELLTLGKLESLAEMLEAGQDAEALYHAFRREERFFSFIFSREEIRELELSFFEYTISQEEENKSRLREEISHIRRQLLIS